MRAEKTCGTEPSTRVFKLDAAGVGWPLRRPETETQTLGDPYVPEGKNSQIPINTETDTTQEEGTDKPGKGTNIFPGEQKRVAHERESNKSGRVTRQIPPMSGIPPTKDDGRCEPGREKGILSVKLKRYIVTPEHFSPDRKSGSQLGRRN